MQEAISDHLESKAPRPCFFCGSIDIQVFAVAQRSRSLNQWVIVRLQGREFCADCGISISVDM